MEFGRLCDFNDPKLPPNTPDDPHEVKNDALFEDIC